MNEEQLFEAVGNIDDDLIEDKRKHKKAWLIPSIAAACFALIAVTGGVLHITNFNGGPEAVSSGASELHLGTSTNALIGETVISIGEMVPLVDYVNVYYCDEDGSLQVTQKLITCSVDNLFAAWREANGIGNEITITETHYASNGEEFSDGSTAGYIAPTYFEYEFTLSSEMDAYFTRCNNKSALIDSLERTLYDYLIGDKDGVVTVAVE